MPFAAATTEKTLAYLGYRADAQALSEIDYALTSINALPDSTGIITRVEGWLSQLDTIFTAINTQRDIDGSTLLPELRREGRRYVVLVANALGLTVQIDVFGSSQT